jgi:drug/metabolite transporter (DMT)-like permease
VTQASATLGIFIALSATLFYGQVPVLVRFAYLEGVPAIAAIVLRTWAVAVVFVIAAMIMRESWRIPRQALVPFLWQCIATLAVSACYLISLQFLPVSLAVIIFFTFPVMVLLASPVIEGHAPSLLRLGVAVFAFAGLALAIGPQFDQLDPLGLLLAALSAVGCALQFFSGRALSAYMKPVAFAGLVHVAILPLIIVLALGMGAANASFMRGEMIQASGLIGLIGVSICYLGGYFLHMTSVQVAPASTVVPFFNLEPVISTLMAVLVLHEKLAVNQMIGGAIVLAALIFCGIIERKAEPQ